jgi:hypothetical protein
MIERSEIINQHCDDQHEVLRHPSARRARS